MLELISLFPKALFKPILLKYVVSFMLLGCVRFTDKLQFIRHIDRGDLVRSDTRYSSELSSTSQQESRCLIARQRYLTLIDNTRVDVTTFK